MIQNLETLSEKVIGTDDAQQREADKEYAEYQKRGGIINRGDYESAEF